ncbi:amidohydrolase family protein [Ruania rhizosphaerae]|uniref:amidohydrolase family protein n=1 Tax=Ruania rhizosphaerae TaxID=1840413 RepID=UPI001358618F|nr:amidohydrolase family protein [Ruania rhizosphaerae]
MTQVLDTHVHLVDDPSWVRAPRLQPVRRPFTPDNIRDDTAPTDVDAIVSVPSIPTFAESQRILDLADDDSLIAAVIGWADLAGPQLAKQLDILQTTSHRFRGLRHPVQRDPDPDWLIRPDVLRGLHELEERDLLFEVLVRPDQLPATVQMASELPEMTFVLNHAGNPPLDGQDITEWEHHIRQLAAHDHVACKLSGPIVHDHHTVSRDSRARCLTVLLDAFGPQRLTLGSNYPLCLIEGPYETTWHTGLRMLGEVGVSTEIASATAARLYLR